MDSSFEIIDFDTNLGYIIPYNGELYYREVGKDGLYEIGDFVDFSLSGRPFYPNEDNKVTLEVVDGLVKYKSRFPMRSLTRITGMVSGYSVNYSLATGQAHNGYPTVYPSAWKINTVCP